MPFTFCEHDDWLIWGAAASAEARRSLAAARCGASDDAEALGLAMQMVTDDVLRLDAGAAAGVWLPEGHGGVPPGTFQGCIYLADRPQDRDVRRFRRGMRRKPRVPGMTITDYNVAEGEADVGRVLVQHMMTHVGGDNPVLSTYRLTVFPEEVEELYVLEFTTAALAMLDSFEESFTGVVAGMGAVAR